ncbi:MULTISPECIES: Crp/Fnr family transcriptional regulator [Chryseobacterium]|uniref:Crp/Fnr family transcriptional regulator n=1 Tax=Chryseobacterium TaxID=59732 RepID=UPI00078744B5|nr:MULTISPECIES: Crp/Fnr family transcriptional regulator [Chryseobacterium]KYH05845.1 cAMP-binding protein [Chryseobacterium cucumeris]MDH5032421.1 Crp/Fnr family transcriptional regulator [Chryseobacterium cucumeris]QWT86067.1 Crp/Fnr family transcriptional regulator [Chryseobacterium sp. PCH239]RKE82505.1 CRP-like cAMP-binding protein [Chryseobacterium sp. AG363]WNI38338.1 Crp/Fnr family transcriptional regulator [Chryseobacterium sp. SG20098]
MLLEKLLEEFDVDPNTFSSEESKLFDQYFEQISVRKNTFLIKEGETEKYSYFVFEGLLRCWIINHKGDEQTFWFCKKGTFSLSNISFTLQEKSAFNVQTIVDSVIYRIDKKKAAELYSAIPRLKTVFDDLTAILLNKILNRNIDLIKYSPEQYYLRMIDEYGVTLNYIPLKDIASYLGITPQALSRIRKRIF